MRSWVFVLVSFVPACAATPVHDEAGVELAPPTATPAKNRAPSAGEPIVTRPITVTPKPPDPPGDAASAEQLFEQGRRAMSDGDVPLACSKFRESLHADRALGTLLNLGACEEQLGRRAQACQAFREAEVVAAQRGQRDRQELAKVRADGLACPP